MLKNFFVTCGLISIFGLLPILPTSKVWVSSSANPQPKFSSVEVNLWPEYDQPAMLVVSTMVLSSDTPLPAEVVLRIPTAAGTPNLLQVGVDPTSFFDIVYQRQVEGQWNVLRFKTPVPAIRLEYYDPTLDIQKDTRQFYFQWLNDYATERVFVQIQQPYGATDIQITPPLANDLWFSDGFLNYYSGEGGNVEAGKLFSLLIRYQKSSSQVTTSGLQVQPSQPISAQTPGRVTWFSTIPWLLVVPLCMFLLALGAVWYWKLNLSNLLPFYKFTFFAPKKQKKIESNAIVASPIMHCHQCGRRAAGGDQFCRSCGVRLRNG